MKILIISGHFYPENTPRAFRTFELAKELARKGNKVKVICFSRQLAIEDYSEIRNKFNIDVEIIPLSYWIPKERILTRLMSLFFAWPLIEIMKKMPKVLKKEPRHDLIISIAVPHQIHWGLARLGKNIKEKCKVWIADCGDPYMGCKTDTFRPPFYFKYIEKKWCRLCDYITIPVESGREGYYKEFWNKIRVIPQGFNFEESKPNREYVKNTVPTFIFAGGFIPGLRDPKLFLEYLAQVKTDFRFIVYTNNDALLQPNKQQLGDKLEIRSYIPRTDLLQELSTADFLVNFENGNTFVQVPSKLIDYSLAGRPVLSVNSYEIDEQNIQKFLKGDYSGQMQMPDLALYDIKNVAKKFLDLMVKNE